MYLLQVIFIMLQAKMKFDLHFPAMPLNDKFNAHRANEWETQRNSN